MKTKVGIILFPGSNCELEALRACKRSKLDHELIRWNDETVKIDQYSAFILPGGFSYEDRGRSGVIAAKDPIMQKIRIEAEKGKPVIGICNGAQILVETGLVPGLNNDDINSNSLNLDMALAWSERVQKNKILGIGYYNDWVYIRHSSKPGRSVFNRFSPKRLLYIPIAHGEGRFTTKNPKLLHNLIQNDQTLFRYCDSKGNFIEEFPVNPNGAIYNLAGVCNPQGNVLALMPHPERTADPINGGQPIFDSLADYLNHPKKVTSFVKTRIQPLKIKKATIQQQQTKPDFTILVELNITDNEERTIEKTVKSLGFKDIKLKRRLYFGFKVKHQNNLLKSITQLIASGEILNLNKETPTIFIDTQAYNYNPQIGLEKISSPLEKGQHFITIEHENNLGKSLKNSLKSHLHDNDFISIERGIHWIISNSTNTEKILQTNIFHNPNSMKLIAV